MTFQKIATALLLMVLHQGLGATHPAPVETSQGKVQGVASNGVLMLGAVFLGELDTLEAIALLEIAIECDLFANDDHLKKGIETCKALDSRKDFDRLLGRPRN